RCPTLKRSLLHVTRTINRKTWYPARTHLGLHRPSNLHDWRWCRNQYLRTFPFIRARLYCLPRWPFGHALWHRGCNCCILRRCAIRPVGPTPRVGIGRLRLGRLRARLLAPCTDEQLHHPDFPKLWPAWLWLSTLRLWLLGVDYRSLPC